MSNAVAIQTSKQVEFTPDQLRLITDTVARGASKEELQLFLHRCQTLGLNPLLPGRVHFIKYGNSPGAVVVGIDGFRTIAQRTGKLAGIQRGVIRNEKGELTHAYCEVKRKDWDSVAREEVPLSEYNTGKAMWAKMPETMLKKVAECAALRMAFPDDLGGVYSTEEMDQAAEPVRHVPTQVNDYALPPSDGIQGDSGWIKGGMYKNRTFQSIPLAELRDYVERRHDVILKDPSKKLPWWDHFYETACDYIASVENAPIEEGEFHDYK